MLAVSHAERSSPLLQLFLAYHFVEFRVDGFREPLQDVFFFILSYAAAMDFSWSICGAS